MEIVAHNLTETRDFAKEMVEKILTTKKDSAVVVALYGDLGSGKTSFTQGVAEALGISNTIISPTFVIERVYKITAPGFTHFIHIDCYRLQGEDELKHLGWDEIMHNPKNIIFVEWAERVEGILPHDVIKIKFEYVDEDTRKITVL